ncbi:MAG: hypothetical protein V2A54_10390, partial [Bacteroidota bacterium]
GVFATIISIPDTHKTLKIIILILCIVLILIAIILILSFYLDLKNAFQILRITKKLGITNIKSNGISDNFLSSKLSNAKNIKVYSCSALIFFRTKEDEIVEALKKNARISVIISSPESDFNNELEGIETRIKGEIKGKHSACSVLP